MILDICLVAIHRNESLVVKVESSNKAKDVVVDP